MYSNLPIKREEKQNEDNIFYVCNLSLSLSFPFGSTGLFGVCSGVLRVRQLNLNCVRGRNVCMCLNVLRWLVTRVKKIKLK